MLIAITGCGSDPDSAPTSSASEEGESIGNPDKLLWGDLHVHSNLSFDSNSFGNENLGPDIAYRFARGEEVTASSGTKVKLSRPLDFLMVADHSEYLGVLPAVRSGSKDILDSELGRRWSRFFNDDSDIGKITSDYVDMATRVKPIDRVSRDFERSSWEKQIDIAERFNKPGEFTTFAGYEWTSMPGGRNLHRVVMFRDGPDLTKKVLPFSALDSDEPEDLWTYLAAYEEDTGGQVMAIAHNGNLSNGLMFDTKRLGGGKITAEYSAERMRWEPVYEVTQVKGDGEAHPLLSPDDRFADFENWDETDISMVPRSVDEAEQRRTLEGEYARSGLKRGLEFARDIGTNPYEFGLMGSTDSHTALSTSDSDNFWGKFLDSEMTADRLTNKMGGSLWANRGLTAAGWTGVWARANTREEIFAAFKRREVYATTGPRIRLRFFGGWNFAPDDRIGRSLVEKGYSSGVPMGGKLSGGASAPTFLVRVLKDPDGANLQFVQIVKGWVAADGSAQEKVFNIGEGPDTGQSQFSLFWRDQDFDADSHAFYYVRAIEIPTKRWTTHDAEKFGLERPADQPEFIRERVYSSPIWYDPSAE
ncbi:DUF3604 domain-containing protein [Altererythrobacter sp. MF3-039]|uniref:DUF3604 domain-containing protein n=1 Tax=Altererythrobacter sp. MF3-039 TaxID=3252901 RepID=UPI00390CB589